MGNQQAVSRDAFNELQTKYYALTLDHNDTLEDLKALKIETDRANELRVAREQKLNELKLILIPPTELNDETRDETPEEVIKARREKYNQMKRASEYIEEYQKYRDNAERWRAKAEEFDAIAREEYENELKFRKEYEDELADLKTKNQVFDEGDDVMLLKQRIVQDEAMHRARAEWDRKIKAQNEKRIMDIRKKAVDLRKGAVPEADLPSYTKTLDELENTKNQLESTTAAYKSLQAANDELQGWLNNEKAKILAQRDADILVYKQQIHEKEVEIANKEQEIKELTENLERSEEACASLQSEIESLHNDNSQLTALLESTKQTLAEREAEIEHLKQELTNFEAKYNEDIAKKDARYNETVATLNSTIESVINQSKEDEAKYKSMLKSLQLSARSTFQKFTDNENALKNELSERDAEIQNLSNELEKLTGEYNDYKQKMEKKVAQNMNDIENLRDDLNEAMDQIEEKEHIIANLSEDKDLAIKRGDELNGLLEALRANIHAMKNDVKTTLTEVGVETSFQENDDNVDDVKVAVNSTIVSYNNKIRDLNNEADKLQQTINTFEERDNNQREKINELTRLNNDLNVKVTDLEDELEETKEDLEQSQNDYASLKEKTDADIAKYLAQIRSLEDELEKVKRESEENLHNTINKMNDKYRKKEESFKNDILDLRQQLEDEINNTQKIDDAVNEAVAPILAKSTATQTQMQNEIDRLREQLDLKNNEDAPLPAIATFNSVSIDDYKIENDNLRKQLQMFKDRDEQQRNRLGDALREVNEKTLQINQLQDDLDEANEIIDRLTKKNRELERVEAQYKEIFAQYTEQTKTVKKLESDIALSEEKLHDYESQLKAKDTKIQELTEQIDIMSTNVNQEGSTAEERKALQEKIAAFEELISTSDDKGKYERLLAVVKKDDAENSKYRKEIASLNLKINEKTWIANNAQKELDDFKEQTKATMEQLTQRIRTNQETTDKEIAEYKAALAKKDQEINELREELGNNY